MLKCDFHVFEKKVRFLVRFLVVSDSKREVQKLAIQT